MPPRDILRLAVYPLALPFDLCCRGPALPEADEHRARG